MGTPDVEVKNAFCAYRTTERRAKHEYMAVKAINLSIEPGEFFCLLGPSGCGKSTILRMIAGFLRPTSGEIVVRGRQIKGPGADRAVVFQGEAALFNWLTVKENIAFGPRLRGIPAKEHAYLVAENIRLVGLEGFEDYYPGQLSGGMKQRLQIARVLANDPEILLMDEPFGALDAQTRDIMQQEVSRIWSSKRKTVVFITHDIEEAILLGDKIAIMTSGPGATIKTVMQVALPRPRELNKDFLELRRNVRGAIQEEVRNSMRHVQ